MKYFSCFSGIGGMELGIINAYEAIRNNKEQEADAASVPIDRDSSMPQHSAGRPASPECVGYSEIDKYAAAIYSKHFPDHKSYGDITKINWATVPDFDLFVGGSPCQDLSIAGKRAGLGGGRSGLFKEYVRALKEKKPQYFIWENVKGALSSNHGWDFVAVISAFTEAGYDVQWQVLNSKNHGVPQNRERIFVVGTRGEPRPEVFPFGEASRTINTGLKQRDSEIASTLRSRYGNGTGSHIKVREATKQGYAEARIGDSINYGLPNSKTRRGRVGGGIAQKLDTGAQQGTLTPEMKIRRLTPTECERLQGFPDGHTEGISDTQRYKTLGNAVTVNVVRDIISRIIAS